MEPPKFADLTPAQRRALLVLLRWRDAALRGGATDGRPRSGWRPTDRAVTEQTAAALARLGLAETRRRRPAPSPFVGAADPRGGRAEARITGPGAAVAGESPAPGPRPTRR